jgi:7-carboxy-7-deazaguanine synthase
VSPDGGVNLVEMFSSVQGEGIHVGATTLFVRFGECDLRCRWCDTPHSWAPAKLARIESARGAGEVAEVENPIPLDDVIASAEQLEVGRHRFVSFTGGEPLLQPGPLAELASRLGGRGPKIHLETHGLHVQALERVLPHIDVVSMDWKLTSDVRRASDPKRGPVAAFHDRHAEFLRVALGAPEVMVKVVLTPATLDDELAEMARRVGEIAPDVAVILQPVTPTGGVKEVSDARKLLEIVVRLESTLPNVRLIPQTHPFYGAP